MRRGASWCVVARSGARMGTEMTVGIEMLAILNGMFGLSGGILRHRRSDTDVGGCYAFHLTHHRRKRTGRSIGAVYSLGDHEACQY